MSDPTLPPTARHLRQASERGDVLASAMWVRAMVSLVLALLIPAVFAALCAWAAQSWKQVLRPDAEPLSSENIASLGTHALIEVMTLIAVPMISVSLVAAITPVLLASRLPWRRDLVAASQGARSLVIGLITAALMVAPSWWVMRALLQSMWAAPRSLLELVSFLSFRLLSLAVVAMLLAAGVDVLFAYFERLRRLRMTDAEVRREQRETNGAPEIRQARARSRHE
ncbi:MAG: EscU/YscU/HrcU family type III secretion system export apparatus switch protein [Polyangiaceae bacterium]